MAIRPPSIHAPTSLAPERLHGAMLDSAAYRSLTPEQQSEIAGSMTRVMDFVNSTPQASRLAQAMAPDLDALRAGGAQRSGWTGGGRPGGGYGAPGSGPQRTPPLPPASGGGSPVDRAPGATAAMLQAISFPDFVGSLVQGTFQAIVDASIQQMEAYAQLLREAVKSIDEFMVDNVSDDVARDHLADTYGDVFQRDVSGGAPQLTVVPDGSSAGNLPTFLKELGFDAPQDIDNQALDEVVVPETRRTLAEMRHQTLATMVMMGINRVVVSDGEINAKLIFNVSATESVGLTFDESTPSSWTLAGKVGRNPFGASGLVVQTTHLNAQQDLNIRADLTGEVRIRFRSETFPLERFADTAAIQLINTRARSFPATAKTGAADSLEQEAAAIEGAETQSFGEPAAPRSASSGTLDPWQPIPGGRRE